MISLGEECHFEVNIVSTILLNDRTQLSTAKWLCREFRLLSHWVQWLLRRRPFLGWVFFVSCWRDQFWLDIFFFQYSRARVCCKMKISWTHNVSHNWFSWKLSGHVYYNLFISTKTTSYQFSQVWFMQSPPAVHYGQILEYPTGYPPEPV